MARVLAWQPPAPHPQRPAGRRALQEEVFLPDGVQGAALDLGDLDALGRQWASTLAAFAEAETLVLVGAWLLRGA